MSKQEHFKREVRLQQIDSLLRQQGRGVALPLSEIAKRVGMRKSKHMDGLVSELCDLGFVSSEWGITHNGLNVRLYSHTGKEL